MIPALQHLEHLVETMTDHERELWIGAIEQLSAVRAMRQEGYSADEVRVDAAEGHKALETLKQFYLS